MGRTSKEVPNMLSLTKDMVVEREQGGDGIQIVQITLRLAYFDRRV